MSNLIGIQSIEMRPAPPARGFWSRGGVGFWREVAAAAAKALKDSGDHVNLPPSIRALQLSTSYDLSQVTKDNRGQFVKALGDEMAQELRRLLVEWRSKYHERAQEFERRLGIYAINAQPAKEAAQKASDIAISYMEHIADSVGVIKAELAAILIQLAGDKKVEAGWGGGCGNDDPQLILAAMKSGNIREQMTHLDLFIENVLGADVLRKTGEQLKRAYAACRQAGMNVRALARRRSEVHKKLGITTNENGELSAPVKKTRLIGSKPRNMGTSTAQDLFKGDKVGFKDAKTPIANTTSGKGMDMTVPNWAKELSQSSLPRPQVLAALKDRARFQGVDLTQVTGSDEEQIAKLVGLLGWGSSSLRFMTTQDTLEFEEGGVKYSAALSEREKRLVANPRDAQNQDLIPWVQGSLVNVVNEEHEWVRQARKRAMPIESAISGTTNRVLNTARMFNFKGAEFPALRLAILGNLINIKAHSFHEIMAAAHGFPECQYVPGRDAYERVAPLKPEQLRSIAPGGKLPHEHGL